MLRRSRGVRETAHGFFGMIQKKPGILGVRCHRCLRFAYTECYEGEFDEDGYLCMGCIRAKNQELVARLKSGAEEKN